MKQKLLLIQVMKDIRGRVGFFHIYNMVDRTEELELEISTKFDKQRYESNGAKVKVDYL